MFIFLTILYILFAIIISFVIVPRFIISLDENIEEYMSFNSKFRIKIVADEDKYIVQRKCILGFWYNCETFYSENSAENYINKKRNKQEPKYKYYD